ncbi:DUF3035 domain-containing protein [Sphingomonas crocodyli]|uniref:DUF3035 domain-containing protein n=1 Tax=Sphingomonas crocodyli TaxID=1979270 RepID=A0A437M4A7_9SPHN|nr:DUF3035 domain-containing protein [Sphingomonas crocodyli]RVT92393.1 DUF3035 domain-containing protein [Sphingomonas crocodyli]
MRSKLLICSALVAMMALSACGGRSKGGVMAGRGAALDEFQVSKRAPLTIPPDFALVPPKPGAPRPQEADSSQQALSAMFAGTAAPKSQTEKDIIGLTGTQAEPGIRSAVAETKNVMVDKGPVTRTILAAADKQDPAASVSMGN